jgi:hypothetical protein
MSLGHWRVRPGTTRPVRGLAAAGLGVLLAAGALGCSGGEADTSGLPTLGASPSAPSASPSPTLGYEPKDPDGIGAWVKVGKIHADIPEEKAAAHAWITFWKIFLQASNERDVKFPVMEKVTTKNSKYAILSDIAESRKSNTYTVGEKKIGVSRVKILGNKAVVTSCVIDGLRVIDAEGKLAGNDDVATMVRVGDLVKQKGRWLVSSWESTDKPVDFCDPER